MIIFFRKIIKPYLIYNNYSDICEIGSCSGEHTDRLLTIDSTRISVIDPCLDADLSEKYKQNSRVIIYKGLSLEILPKLSEKFDCIIIDADHNWYTVYNELKSIEEKGLLQNGGTIFLHDVYWPYARRDMYYLPQSIPQEFRHPYAQAGLIYGVPGLSQEPDAFNRDFFNALHEGGARNGVLTAIEDFLKTGHKNYYFFILREEYGLGILIKKEKMKLKTLILLFGLFLLQGYYGVKFFLSIKEKLRKYRFLVKFKKKFLDRVFNFNKKKAKA
jgi:hypothetical protein